MSMHQYQHLEELRKIRAKQTAQSKPTYQSIVKVKLDKPKSESRTDRTDSRDLREGRATLGSLRQHNDDRDDRRETSEKEERGDEYLEELYEKEYKDEDQKKGINVSRRDVGNEMQEIGKPSGTSGRALSSKKQAKKGRDVEDQEDTDNLIASIDLENKVLQLKHKGLKDSEIISKLKGRYKESEIRDVLSNI